MYWTLGAVGRRQQPGDMRQEWTCINVIMYCPVRNILLTSCNTSASRCSSLQISCVLLSETAHIPEWLFPTVFCSRSRESRSIPSYSFLPFLTGDGDRFLRKLAENLRYNVQTKC